MFKSIVFEGLRYWRAADEDKTDAGVDEYSVVWARQQVIVTALELDYR
jgi:hypothetical protein